LNKDKQKGIEAFVKPRSVAVIGASDRPGSWGSFIMEGLLTWKFPGRIYPVNHRAETVFGIPAYHHISSIPDEVDLVVLTIPAESVHETIQACAAKGVKGITIITAGFSEAAKEGREREEELARLARTHGMRLLGPNVSGTFNLHDRFNASASPARFLFPTMITAICQGGYAIYDLMAGAFAKQMGVGQFIHTGNECDLQVADFLEYFGEDPQTRVILMYIETIRDVARFRKVAAEVTKRKPVIVYKGGCTPGGTRAARSHTGAMAGGGEIYAALFRQLNVIQSPTMELMIPLAHAFLEFPPMMGNRVGIVTMGGSWGVALTDTLEKKGLKVPELSPTLQKRLREMGMPIRASTRNPIDIGAAGPLTLSVEILVEMGREILQSHEVDALILHGLGRPGMVSENPPPARKFMLEWEKRLMKEYYCLMDEVAKPVLLGCHLLPWQSQAVHDLTQEGCRIFHRLDEIADILALRSLYQRRLKQQAAETA